MLPKCLSNLQKIMSFRFNMCFCVFDENRWSHCCQHILSGFSADVKCIKVYILQKECSVVKNMCKSQLLCPILK